MWIIIYLIIFAVASLPLACGYVMEGGDITIWIARIEELTEHLRMGQLLLFPSAELTVEQGGQLYALNSNVWLLFPATIRLLGGNVTLAYRLYLLLLNAIALFAAKKMFEELCEDKIAVMFGVLLYMTSPYRVYMCYDKANLGMIAAWSLIPLVIWGLFQFVHSKATWKSMLVTAVAFAAIGYADGILLLILTGILMLGMIWYRKIKVLLPLFCGGILFLPGAVYLLRYLLKGGMEVWGFPLHSIASEGYEVGQIFSSWVYFPGHPGLGLGLLIGLFVLVWLGFVENNPAVMKKYGFFVITMCLLTFMSMKIFPWDMVQRLGMPFLRLVSLLETPGVCFGFAILAACVLSAYGVQCVTKQSKLFVQIGIPLIIAFAAMGVSVYLCNTLTYHRVPMFF